MLNDFGMEGASMFPNILTFNANTGQWKLRKDGETNPIDMPSKVVMDLNVFQKGWNLILKGQAPQSHLVKWDKPFPVKPGEEFKKTFCIRVYGKDIGLCEFGSNSNMVSQAIQKFFNTYLEGRPDENKIAVVAINANGSAGEWFIPNLQVVKYIDRPEGLTEVDFIDSAPNLASPTKSDENQFGDTEIPPHMNDTLGKQDKKKKAIPYTKEEEDAEMAKLDDALGVTTSSIDEGAKDDEF
mgnify:CR=1 FL=1